MHDGFRYRHDVGGAQGVVRRSASYPNWRMSMDEVEAVDELGPGGLWSSSQAAGSTGRSHLRCSIWSSVIWSV